MLQASPGLRAWLRAQDWGRLAYFAATLFLLLIGTYFRSRRYWVDPVGLWGDEASWMRRLFKPSLTNFEFRPIGYMLLSRVAVHVYSYEGTLRILSQLGALASLLITVDLGRYLFKSRAARVLCLAVVAFHPLLIDMAREFKPYSEEFCVHLGLIWLFLRWRANGTRAWLYALLSCSAVSFALAYNVVFLLPATFGLVGVRLLQRRAFQQLLTAGLAALTAFALMGSVYFVVIRNMNVAQGGEHFWGKKYDVFYLSNEVGREPQSHLRWLGNKDLDLATFPNVQRDKWTFPESVGPLLSRGLVVGDGYLWILLHALGLIALLFPGRRDLFVLLVLPLGLAGVFNTLGLWPFGVFRSNAFLLAYYIPIAMVGLDALIARGGKFGLFVAAFGCFTILVPNLTIGYDSHARKHFFTTHSELPSVLRRMKALRDQAPESLRAEKTTVLIDGPCAPWEFYRAYSSSTHREFGDYLSNNFDFECVRSPRYIQSIMRDRKGKSFFVVVMDERLKAATNVAVRHSAHVLDQETVRDTEDLYFAIAK